MKRMGVAVAAFLVAGVLAAQTPTELFQKAKAQVRGGAWQDALKTIGALDAEAAKPANAQLQQQLQGPLAFLRGVCEANLDQPDKARADFAMFLAMQPGASIDPGLYSKKAVAAFESARKAAAPPGAGAVGAPTMFSAFQEFKPPPNISEQANENWADGPVQWIMTSDEMTTWSELSSGGERAEFVEKFWQVRNPKPGSDDNPFRTTFERRVAFADTYFAQDEKKRGSLTDRGMVFVLLGPPNFGGHRPLDRDRTESNGTMVYGTVVSGNGNKWFYSPSTSAPDSESNFQEIWHYRRELLPRGVSYLQVDVTFLTKKGYGVNVLQRDSQTLTTLEAAKKLPPAVAISRKQ